MTANNEAITEFVRSTTNHTPSAGTILDIESFRAAVQDVAAELIVHVAPSRARSVALTHLEDAVMWGVKALILDEA
jgi:2-keto-3-deoxy-6-phosphogluconate aldolase